MRGFPACAQRALARDLSGLLARYAPLLDAQVLEFFTDELWAGLLPPGWQAALAGLTPPQLAALLLERGGREGASYPSVWPLSLLAFRAAAHALAFPRSPAGRGARLEEFRANPCQSSRLDPLFRKHVKPKKQHEIRRLAQLVKKLSDITGCRHVVDVGSGQGHLSRFLAFGCHLSVTAVEEEPRLVDQAVKFDQELHRALKKERAKGIRAAEALSLQGPAHVVGRVDPTAPWQDFLHLLQRGKDEGGSRAAGSLSQANRTPQTSPGRPEEKDGQKAENRKDEVPSASGRPEPLGLLRPPRETPMLLTGLHACGDLSVALLRHFVRCPHVVGMTSVACCYMKLTVREAASPAGSSLSSEEVVEHGYPLSAWVSGLPGHRLSYRAREGACHAIEDYGLKLVGESSTLRTHCLRAMLEVAIRAADPAKKRLGVQTINKSHLLSSEEYIRLGLARVGLDPNVALDQASLESMLGQQQKVVAFFCLALLLAPLVETLIMVDRMLYLQEQGFQCELIPLFNPTLSPRNLVLVAAKTELSSVLSGWEVESEEAQRSHPAW